MASTLVRLVSRNDGTYSAHHPDTGRVLMELQQLDQPGVERRADLEDQIETAVERREQERAQELVAGLVLGLVAVAGFALGWLVFHT